MTLKKNGDLIGSELLTEMTTLIKPLLKNNAQTIFQWGTP